MTVELYGFGSEPSPDETAQTASVRAWQEVQEVFAGSLQANNSGGSNTVTLKANSDVVARRTS